LPDDVKQSCATPCASNISFDYRRRSHDSHRFIDEHSLPDSIERRRDLNEHKIAYVRQTHEPAGEDRRSEDKRERAFEIGYPASEMTICSFDPY
jgi:hypothetical protein